jgi:HrpA-like RNA helicase
MSSSSSSNKFSGLDASSDDDGGVQAHNTEAAYQQNAQKTSSSSKSNKKSHNNANADTKSASTRKQGGTFETGEKLPIDEHREIMLERIRQDRVIIIHGETGCGKSSRLPQFLLEDAIARGEVCVAQSTNSEVI